MSLLTAATFGALAQSASHTFGNNDTTRLIPNNNCWNYSLTEQIFTPEEVGVTGYIKSISFYVEEDDCSSRRQIQMFVGTTSKNSFVDANDWIDPATLTQVFNGSWTFFDGKNTILLDFPFAYDGSENLVICFHDWTGTSETNTNRRAHFQASHDAPGTSKAIVAFCDDNDIVAPDFATINKKISDDRSVTTFTTTGTDDLPTTFDASLPLAGNWNYSISQQIFTPEEVGGTGTIHSITFHDFSEFVGFREVVICRCAASRTEFNGNPKLASTWVKESFMTQVYSGSVNFSSADVTVNFNQTFHYDGTSNLILAVVDRTGSYDHSLKGTMDLKPGEYRTLMAYADAYQLSFSTPQDAAYAYALPYVNRVSFFDNYGITVNGENLIPENASTFNVGLTSGYIIYDPEAKTLTLDNVETSSDFTGHIDCRYHNGDLTIIANGYNNIHDGKIRCVEGYTTTLVGDTFDLGYLEIRSEKGSATAVIDNTTLLVNLEEDNSYALFGYGNDEHLIINNSYVKSFAQISNYDEFASIALIDCEIAYPAGAVVDGGYITLNGSEATDTVIIIPTKGAGLENVTSTTFSLFPNPAESEVTLHLMPFEGTAHMSIFSADGRIMNVAELPAIDSDYRMNVTSLPAGIYYITITSDSLRQTATLIKK